MAEFFQMGGYAPYVWISYLLTFLVLVANFVLPLQRERHLLRQLAKRMAREEA